MTYSELKEKVISWIDYADEDFCNQLDFFVELAEKEAARLLQLPITENYVELSVKASKGSSCFIPDDYMESKEMFLEGSSELIRQVSLSELLRRKANIDKSSGFVYARKLNSFVFYPNIPETDRVHFIYYADLNNLKNADDTSSVLNLAPGLMVYLTVKQGMIFLKNPEEASVFNELAQNELNQLRAHVQRMDNKQKSKIIPKRVYKGY